jgi:hypothetical protein
MVTAELIEAITATVVRHGGHATEKDIFAFTPAKDGAVRQESAPAPAAVEDRPY